MKTNVKTFLATGTAAIAIGLSAGSAQAITFSFPSGGLVGNAPGVSSINFSQGGIGLTATAVDENNASRNVIQNNQGLGVYTSGADSVQVDANGLDETLRLTFDQTVKIISATFSRVGSAAPIVGGNDFYTLFSDAGAIATSQDIPGGNVLDTDTGTVNFAAFLNTTGTVFSFTVPGGSGLNTSDYQLNSVDVEAIPTPALLPGLLGFGFSLVRKRKQETQAAALV